MKIDSTFEHYFKIYQPGLIKKCLANFVKSEAVCNGF